MDSSNVMLETILVKNECVVIIEAAKQISVV